MEVNIAVRNVAREITLETDLTAHEVQQAVADALANRTPLSLTDTKGRQMIIPADALGYVLVGEPEKAKVGFGTR